MRPVHLSILIFAYLVSGHRNRNQESIHVQCQNESGFEGNYKDIDLHIMPRPAMCYIACTMVKRGLMRHDGRLNMVNIRRAMAENSRSSYEVGHKMKILNDCRKEVTPDPQDLCESIYLLIQCVESVPDAISNDIQE